MDFDKSKIQDKLSGNYKYKVEGDTNFGQDWFNFKFMINTWKEMGIKNININFYKTKLFLSFGTSNQEFKINKLGGGTYGDVYKITTSSGIMATIKHEKIRMSRSLEDKYRIPEKYISDHLRKNNCLEKTLKNQQSGLNRRILSPYVMKYLITELASINVKISIILKEV